GVTSGSAFQEQQFKGTDEDSNLCQNIVTFITPPALLCSEVLEAIENVIEDVLKSLAQKKAPVLTLANRSDWRNIEQSLCHLMFKELKGRGVPDLNTRLLVRKLWDAFQIPVFTLMDADPHGVEIMCIYKYGSVSMSFEAHHLTVPSIKWLGLLPSDLERLVISLKETEVFCFIDRKCNLT
ncbi:Spo11, partial [Columba guinea]